MKIVLYRLLIFLFLLQIIPPAIASSRNLAMYRIVFHSSSLDANHCGHLVVDGSQKTYWESQPGNNQWITIDLNSLQTINKVVIHWGTNFGSTFKVTALTKNGTNGKEIFSTLEGKGGISTIYCPGIKTQVVKLDISKVADPTRGCVINEIEVFGEGPERFEPSTVMKLSVNHLSLKGKQWRIQNAMFVNDRPQDIAKPGYPDQAWIPASVPGTILGSYYDFGALPDPLFGDNMHQISDEFFSGNDFWYRISVRFPSQLKSRRMFLDFSGINWKAEIYFNGCYVGRIDGAFQRAEFEVTKLIDKLGSNAIAVLVHHPDNWVPNNHKVIRKSLGARTTNGDLLGLDSPTMLASSGWNWLPIVKGRNMGIWNDVTFRSSGNVSINDPWVSSFIPLPDTTKADLTIHADLKNHSSEVINGTLVERIGEAIVIEHPVKLNAGESRSVALDKTQYLQLALKNPKLWWPNGYGQPNLYTITLEFIEHGKVSDQKKITFGIRQVEYKVVDTILFFYCNGKRLLLRGGNWGMPEALLRCDSVGYDTRVKLHKDANLNMIRNWIGMTGHEAFYDACDRYGILIWDDFWLANPVDGPNNPKDAQMFMNNVRDKIKWVRKHPSLAIYCGRNEGLPPPDLDIAMKHETQVLDGTRYYISNSAAGTVTGLGPYDVRDPKWYFINRGFTLHSELGIISFPEAESMRKMMQPKDLWPINDMWAIHDYQWGRSEKFTARIESRYGAPSGMEDYCRRAQMLNYESAKAMFECLQSNQGSGVLLWMTQSAWPAMICQLYDHYFEYTSSFFAVKKACQPIHILWDIVKNDIRVANNSVANLRDAVVKATLYDTKGIKLWEKSVSTDVLSSGVKSCFPLDHHPLNKVIFLKLDLLVRGKVIDDNFYWLENNVGNCLDLNDLPLSNVSMQVKGGLKDGFYTAIIKVKNVSPNLSLLNKIKVKDKNTGESILPVYLSDDYISMLPYEEKTIILRIEEKLLRNTSPEIQLEGWKTEKTITELTNSTFK